MAEHNISKLEKRIAVLEDKVHRLEAVGHAKDFNFMEDYVKAANLKKNFKKAQDENTTLAAIGEGG
jgi:hypothetical protein